MGHYVTEKSYINLLIRKTKDRCRRNNMYFDLSFEQYRELILRDCHFCGQAPVVSKRRENRFMNLATSSIDRVDNSKGYTTDNTVPSCIQCNYMKASYSLDDFLNKCKAVYEFSKKKKA